MFPLGMVLLPHAVLPLHVFEPRYRVLMFDCLRGEREFGVVLIERGHETGGGDQRFATGTVARIVEAGELPDGRWVLYAVGTRRVRVAEWLPDDPYPVAMVDELDDGPWSGEADAARSQAEAAVDRVVALADVLAVRRGVEIASTDSPDVVDRAATAGWDLIAAAPIGPLDRQELLEIDDPAGRLRRLTVLAEEQAVMLACELEQE